MYHIYLHKACIKMPLGLEISFPFFLFGLGDKIKTYMSKYV